MAMKPIVKNGVGRKVPQGGLSRSTSPKATPLLPTVGSPGGGSRTKAVVKPVKIPSIFAKVPANRLTPLAKGAVKPSPVKKPSVTVSMPVRKVPAKRAKVERKVLTVVPQGMLQRSIIGRYFFLPTDFLLLLWRGIRFAWRERLRVASVSIVAIVAWYGMGAGVEGTAFLAFLAAVFAWDLDGRVSIGAGLACLVLIVVLQALIQSGVLLLFEESTETVAVWAYYFLCIGVLKQLVDLVREGRRKSGTGGAKG